MDKEQRSEKHLTLVGLLGFVSSSKVLLAPIFFHFFLIWCSSVDGGGGGGGRCDLHSGGPAAARLPQQSHGKFPADLVVICHLVAPPTSRLSPSLPPVIGVPLPVCEGRNRGEASAPPVPFFLHGRLLLCDHLPFHLPLLHLHQESAGHPHWQVGGA